MKGVTPARVAFWIGILSVVFAILSGPFNLSILGVRPLSFIHFANTWMLISAVILLTAILENLKS